MVAFTIALRQSNDDNLINFLLNGIRYASYLLGRYKLETQRDSFISSLYKQTNLEKNLRLTRKNILCIQTLFTIASEAGGVLRSSWKYIFKFLSKLDHLLTHAHGVKRDQDILGDRS